MSNCTTVWSSEQSDPIESCIERWQERMQQSRDWVCFIDLADWCARESGSINPDERKRTIAYQQLGESLKLGEFGTGKHTQVAYPDGLILKRHNRYIRMTTQTYDKTPEGSGRRDVLERCWVPRDLARKWLEAKRLPVPPWLSFPDGRALGSAPRASRQNACLSHQVGGPHAQLVESTVMMKKDELARWLEVTKHPGGATEAVVQTLAAEKEMAAWLTRKMLLNPGVVAPKATVRAEAVANGVREIPDRAFDRAWQEAARAAEAPKWLAKGRRKSRPLKTTSNCRI